MGDEAAITEVEVRKAIENHLRGQNYQIVDFKIGQANDEVLGLLGEHLRITANVLLNGKDKQLKYFAKKDVTKNPAHKYYTEGVRVFYKEIEHYKTLFQDMDDALSEGRRSQMKWRPGCYFTRDHNLLIEEDLAPDGYYMYPERTLFTLEYMKATLDCVAKMHASGFGFEEKLHAGLCKTRSPNYQPGKKQTIGELYPNLTYESECSDITPEHPGHRLWETGFKSQKAVIDLLPNYTPKQKAEINENFLKICRQVFRMVEPSTQFRNIMCHGDLWCNNILFRNGPDGKVNDAVLVDFQTTRYCPPTLDIYMLLYLAQERSFRQKYETEIKEHYYAALTRELAAEGLDVKKILPKAEFEASCDYYRRFAILEQFIYTQLNFTPPEICSVPYSTPEGFQKNIYEDRSELIKRSILEDKFCRERSFEAMEEIIEEFKLLASPNMAEEIPTCELSEEEVKQAIANHLRGQNYQYLNYKIGDANDKLLGFLGEHLRITANVILDGKQQEIKYFVKKQITKNQEHRAYSIGVKAFYKEIEHYKTLLADMEDAISPSRREETKWRPSCYFTRDHDLVLVEDLSTLGYYMFPERTLMPIEYMEAVLRAVAKSHASSMVFEEKLSKGLCKTRSPLHKAGGGKQMIGDLYPNLTFETECSDISKDHPGSRFWQSAFTSQAAVIDLLPNYTADQKAKITKRFQEIGPQIFRWVEPSKKFRNVLCHADLWGNNILFRNGPDGKVKEAVLLDFQTTRYTPPALDIFQFLHLMQDTAFRAKNESYLKEYYYKALTAELKAEGFSVEELLPRKEFDESCVFYKRYAILGQFIFTQLNYTPQELTESFFATSEDFVQLMYVDRSELLRKSVNSDENCRARSFEALEEIIKEFKLLE